MTRTCVALLVLALLGAGCQTAPEAATSGRQVMPASGNYPVLPPVSKETVFQRPRPGDAVRVTAHELADAGDFGSDGIVVMRHFLPSFVQADRYPVPVPG